MTVPKPKLFDVIQLTKDITELGLKAGDTGAIIEIYDTPNVAYEVEFVNEDGSEKATTALTADQFVVIDIGPWGDE